VAEGPNRNNQVFYGNRIGKPTTILVVVKFIILIQNDHPTTEIYEFAFTKCSFEGFVNEQQCNRKRGQRQRVRRRRLKVS